ncbi:Protein of unknown function [Bacillus cytotoxicus]|nr:Protein of unknown function [Bacillus cytotoxicus]
MTNKKFNKEFKK